MQFNSAFKGLREEEVSGLMETMNLGFDWRQSNYKKINSLQWY